MSKELGFITGIFISPPTETAANPRGGFPMVRLAEAELVQNCGIMSMDGRKDRYFGPNGVKSAGAYPPDRVRQLSLISLDAIAQTGNFYMIETRRNIVISSTSAEALNLTVERNIRIGDAEICVAGLCEPCERPSKLANKKGFKESFTNGQGISIGGIRAEIIKSGIIQIGQTVYLD
jgi:hypothetical protein